MTPRQQKTCFRKMMKVCGTPADFVFTYVEDASMESDVRRMREYVACVNKVEREYKKKYKV